MPVIKTTIKSWTGNMNPGFRTNTIRVFVVLMSAINTTFLLISFVVPGLYAHKVAGNLVDREPPVDSMHLLLFSGKWMTTGVMVRAYRLFVYTNDAGATYTTRESYCTLSRHPFARRMSSRAHSFVLEKLAELYTLSKSKPIISHAHT